MQEARLRQMLGLILALAAITSRTAAVVYLFGKPEYSFNEGEVADVVLHRSLETGDSSGAASVTLTTVCPTDCPYMSGAQLATEGNSDDFTLTKTATFTANLNQATIPITIVQDTVEESREYFCLVVADANTRGSQWNTRIIIPWNDDCVELFTPVDGDNTLSSPGYYVTDVNTARNGYVGPWSGTNPATISVTPQFVQDIIPVTGDGKDINIFLVNSPDFNSLNAYYGIHLDDSAIDDVTHLGAGNADDSYISDSVLSTAVGSAVAGDYVIMDETNTFELTYDTGAISLTRTLPATPPISAISETDATSALTNIGHLIVSSARNKYAFWKVCGLDYKLLPTKIASASGQFSSNTSPDKAIDGDRGPYINTGSCFVSSGSDPWLQIDLGRVFEVNKVIIFPVVDDGSGDAVGTWLDNGRVYVGSCRASNISGNTECKSDIGTVPVNGGIIEVTCDTAVKAYGRYVYILPVGTSTNALALCEVQVFGDEVPIADETKVEFSTNETTVGEADGNAVLTLTRTGGQNTCTYVEYYTDTSVNDADFTDIPLTAPMEFTINSDSPTISIPITNDLTCEGIEKFNVYLQNIEGGRLGTQCSTSVEITDDDMVTYALSETPYIASEGLAANIQVTRTGAKLDGSAELTFTDGTTEYGDYMSGAFIVEFTASGQDTINYPLVTIEDDEYEEDETFTVSLGNPKPSTCGSAGSPQTAIVTITDDDSKFKWDVPDTSIIIKEGAAATTLTVSREGIAQTKRVDIIVDGDGADTPSDFSVVPSRVSFIGISDAETVTINVVDDSVVESDESFTITLEDPNFTTSHRNLEDPFIVTVTIQDNDAEYRWEKSSYSVGEGDGEVSVCLLRTGDTTTSKTVQITSEGGNTAGLAQSSVDFTPLTSIMLDGAKKCVSVTITGDSNIEESETFTLTITQDPNIAIGSPSVTTVTINDDDATVGFERNSYSFLEASRGSVRITKSGNQEVTVNVVSTNPSTATSGVDFEPVSTNVIIPAGASTLDLRLDLIDDDEDEPNEVFTLTLSLPAGSSATILQGLATITITDDDPTPKEPPVLGSGAIAAITIAGIVAVITVIGAIVFLVYMFGGGIGASAAGAGATGGTGAGAALGDYGNQLAAFGYPSSGAYNATGYGYGNTSGFGMGNNYFGTQYM